MKTGSGLRAPGSEKQERAANGLGERYARQVIVPGIGEAGQVRLAGARVVVLGAGGLGFPVLSYLGAAGVGSVAVIDCDLVEASNLNRQCLFSESDLGQPKAGAAARRLRALNSEVSWEPVQATLTEELAARLLVGSDLALDCADNWEARAALAAAAWRAGVPLLHGAVAAFEGTLAWFAPPDGPCFRCVYPEPSRLPGPTPVLGAVPGVVGSLMATEAIRALCGIGRRRSGELLMLDLERGSFEWVTAPVDPACPSCGGAR
jgi:molybdopterin/thiamine biosynthesis adenylyltransferase